MIYFQMWCAASLLICAFWTLISLLVGSRDERAAEDIEALPLSHNSAA